MNMQTRSLQERLMRERVQATRDRRRLLNAVDLAIESRDFSALEDLYSMAWRFGDVRSIMKLRDLGVHPEADILDWLCGFALPRFDCYTDPETRTYRLDRRDGEFLDGLLKSHSISWERAIESAQSRCKGVPDFRFKLLELFARGEEAVVPWNHPSVSVEDAFRAYACSSGLEVLRCMQTQDRSVYLVRDADGIFKIFKQQDIERDDCYDRSEDGEFALNERLRGIEGIVPCFGSTDIGEGYSFLRFGFAYGQSLLDFIKQGRHVSPDHARAIIGRLAGILTHAHDAHVAHLDLRPENVVVDGCVVSLLDFGDSRSVAGRDAFSTTHLQDPWYAPPEVILRAEGGCPSDVFQLGILFHLLLTGHHSFLERLEKKTDEECVYDALANLNETPDLSRLSEYRDLIAWMLSHDPRDRPRMSRVASELCVDRRVFVDHPVGDRGSAQCGELVLVPARMAVPHRGHIDLISRLLDLGYSPIVSLQYSYFHDEENPVPKWLVLKMIAASLRKRGHDPNRISWMCTPMFETDEWHRLHFSMMPRIESIRAVVTGNMQALHLFPGLHVIDQWMLFGAEGEPYQIRSWGHMLRNAIREGDHGTYLDLIAEGADLHHWPGSPPR